MIDTALQFKDGLYVPFTEEDLELAKDWKDNQVLRAKISGVKKPRSYQQLKMFFAVARQVATNTEDSNWNTSDKVKEQVKVALQFIDTERIIVKPNGDVHIPYRSIAFDSLGHMEACNFFDRSWPVMAKHLGVTPDELLEATGKSL